MRDFHKDLKYCVFSHNLWRFILWIISCLISVFRFHCFRNGASKNKSVGFLHKPQTFWNVSIYKHKVHSYRQNIHRPTELFLYFSIVIHSPLINSLLQPSEVCCSDFLFAVFLHWLETSFIYILRLQATFGERKLLE